MRIIGTFFKNRIMGGKILSGPTFCTLAHKLPLAVVLGGAHWPYCYSLQLVCLGFSKIF